MQTEPYLLEETNLSIAWGKVMLRLLRKGAKELCPLVVNINLTDGKPSEVPEIRDAIDTALTVLGKPSCHTTANTVFPTSLWNPNLERQVLFARYERILPRLRKCHLNCYGIYFERLVKHGVDTNQLDHILRTWEKGHHRRSALQALIFDPTKDHSHQRRRIFPCLQHVTFAASGGELMITGVYCTQYIFDRAYGNYLGLCNLGQFMAHEMGLRLTRMQCITTVAALGTTKKTGLQLLKTTLLSIPELQVNAINQTDSGLCSRKPMDCAMSSLFDQTGLNFHAR